MKLFFKVFTLIIIGLLPFVKLEAQEIAGGEFSWFYANKDSLVVKLYLYASCKSPAPNDAVISIRSVADTQIIDSKQIKASSSYDVTNVCLSQCSPCLSQGCDFPFGFRKYTYTTIFVFDDSNTYCDIVIFYQQHERSASITNAGPASAFYLEAKLDRCLEGGDQSPVFLNDPLFLYCKEQLYIYSLVAFDNDVTDGNRDSVVYELCTPKITADSLITYNGSFTYQKPLSFNGFPNSNLSYPKGFHLDSYLAELAFQPQKAEQVPLAVRLKVYREGKLISELTREWLQIVMDCPPNLNPSIVGSLYREHCAENDLIMAFTTQDYNPDDKPSLWLSSALDDVHFVITGTPPNFTGYINWLPENNMSSFSPYFFSVGVRDNVCPVDGRQQRTVRLMLKENVKAEAVVADSGCGYYHFHQQDIYGNPVSTDWHINAALSSDQSSFMHHFDRNDTFEIKMTMTAGNGCKFIRLFYLLSNTEPPSVYAGKGDSICYASYRMLLYGQPTNENSFWEGKGIAKDELDWFFDPTSTDVEANKMHSLFYHYQQSQYCVGVDTLLIYVIETEDALAGSYPEICQGAAALKLKGKPAGGKWYGSFVKNDLFSPLYSGQYVLVYEATTKGKCPKYDTTFVLVNPSPEPRFSAFPVNGDVPLTVSFTDSSTIILGSISDYMWNFGDGTLADDYGSTSHTYQQAGDYSVVLILKSDKGCENYHIETNVVNAWPQSIEDEYLLKFLIFPQPAVEQVVILMAQQYVESVQLFDMNGRFILEKKVAGQESVNIERGGLEAGIYLLKINMGNGFSAFRKLMFR